MEQLRLSLVCQSHLTTADACSSHVLKICRVNVMEKICQMKYRPPHKYKPVQLSRVEVRTKGGHWLVPMAERCFTTVCVRL